jgi:hypothetical protein
MSCRPPWTNRGSAGRATSGNWAGIGTRSDAGRDCRDAFLGLAKTCAKLGISFWDYLGARLVIAGTPAIPYLPQLVAQRCPTA